MLESLDPGDLTYIVHHAFMPPHLPQRDQQHNNTHNDFSKDQALASAVAAAASAFPFPVEKASPIRMMLARISFLHGHAYKDEEVLEQLSQLKTEDTLALLVREQNAGLLFRVHETSVTVEVFEAAVPAETTLAHARIAHTFPGPAVDVPREEFERPEFQRALANYLMHMNRDVLEGSAALSTKAGSLNIERREVAHPRYISELLFDIFAALGGGTSGNTIRPSDPCITKRIADDVLWENAFMPWRRSPLWLLIRVALQTSLPQDVYKAFMLDFMCHIGQACSSVSLAQHFDNDTLDWIRKKLARRAHKLETGQSSSVLGVHKQLLNTSLKVCEAVTSVLQTRWQEALDRDAAVPAEEWDPRRWDVADATRLELQHSWPVIDRILSQDAEAAPSAPFNPSCDRRIRDLNEALSRPQDAIRGPAEGTFLTLHLPLFDFEEAVRHQIQSWTTKALDDAAAIERLCTSLKTYVQAADRAYSGNPETQSIMILTMFELWVAIDKIACRQLPLLLQHLPALSAEVLEDLLFRREHEIDRLHTVVNYLNQRSSASTAPSIFDTTSTDAFAIRYYDRSQEHQSLRTEIEESAQTQRERKFQELEQLNQEHRLKQCWYDTISHTYEIRYSRGREKQKHSPGCEKCLLKREMDQMTIRIHEWPLPTRQHALKLFLFERHVPSGFSAYRSISNWVLDLLTPEAPESSSSSPHVTLPNYRPEELKPHDAHTSDLTLASKTKSYMKTHYATISIPASRSDVAKEHALQWFLYDTVHGRPVHAKMYRPDVAQRCSQYVSEGLYQALQAFVATTLHQENSVVASQSGCPQELDLEEYLHFGLLRSGGNLQWMNILRAFATRVLSFRAQSVFTLLSQAAQQCGPFPTHAHWHHEVQSNEFCLKLLSEMTRALNAFKRNRQQAACLKAITLLTVRVLASQEDKRVRRQAENILVSIRRISTAWIKEAVSLAGSEMDDFSTAQQVREVSGLCILTFDSLQQPFSTPSDLSAYMTALITTQDFRTTGLQSDPSPRRLLLDRVSQIAHSLEGSVREALLAEDMQEAIDQAVREFWETFDRGSQWTALPAPGQRWLTCSTTDQSKGSSMTVHLSLLEGVLLVNGKTIGKLPREITSHGTYEQLLGQQILAASPADLPGFDYQSVKTIHGHQLYFKLAGQELHIQSRSTGDEHPVIHHQRYLPRAHFQYDFPDPIFASHHFWLDLDRSTLELRPIDAPWSSSEAFWNLNVGNRSLSRLSKSEGTIEYLLEPRSKVGRSLASRIPQSFESHRHLVSSVCGNMIQASLPRLKLKFIVDTSITLEIPPIHCDAFPGSIVDLENQSVGTFIGLESKLVLTEQTRNPVRRVLIPIPSGTLSSIASNRHFTVRNLASEERSRTFAFLDFVLQPDLGRLYSASGGIKTALWKVLLHATTGGVLDDPLTHRTGVQSALAELSSAACFTFESLTTEEIGLLDEIRKLTPVQKFYPPEMRVMQTKRWRHDIPLSSQIPDFHQEAEKTKSFYRDLTSVFYPTAPAAPPAKFEEHLLSRRQALESQASIALQTDGSTMAMYRDRSWERQSSLVNNNPTPFQVTSALFSGQSLLAFKSSQLYDIFKTWPFVSLENDNAQPFVYNARKWLKEPSAHVPQLFGSVFHAAVHSTEATKADALFSLAVLAFEGHSVTAVLPYFVGFFQHHRPLATCGLPPAIIYENLAQGLLPDVRVLTAFAKQTSVPYASTPSARLPQEVDEDLEDWDQRRRDHFDRRQVELSRLLVQQVSSQWNPAFSSPRLSIAHIDSSASQYYALSELQDLVEAYYERLLENNRLNNFATSVESCISRLFGVLHQPQPPPVSPKLQSKPLSTSKPNSCRVHPTSLKHLIDIRAPPQPSVTLPTGNKTVHVHCDKAENAEELEYIAQDLARDGVPLHSFCARGLQASITSLTHRSEATETTPLEGISIPLKLASSMLKDFRVALKPSSPAELVLEAAGLWPSCDLRSVLTLLQQINRTSLTSEWLSSLCQLSAAVILGQQHTRISRLRRTRQKIDLDRELSNLVALDVDQLRQYPDWALIQIDGDFRASSTQLRVTEEMLAPATGSNICLQLNMGEGKSSVIVPLLAAALADKTVLPRVVVLKPLARQMFNLLSSRLSAGLPNRRIFFLPFSRDLQSRPGVLPRAQSLHELCIRSGGILVCQPEHGLSAKLLAVDAMLHSKNAQTNAAALSLSRLLLQQARDILDESDELLHPRYQLIYTLGDQAPVDSRRWRLIQEVLGLVSRHAQALSITHQQDKKLVFQKRTAGSFPTIRAPRPDDSDFITKLLRGVSKDIVDGHITAISPSRFSAEQLQAFHRILETPEISVEDQQHFASESVYDLVLLLRGLFSLGLLQYVLCERQFRVDYGLDLGRSQLAVPFRAKDLPAPRAEFGQPDIAIILTCLSYYYRGIDHAQAVRCLEHLLKENNPSETYGRLVTDLPKDALESIGARDLEGINFKDEQQLRSVSTLLGTAKAMIDYHLNKIVFPRAMKEFPHKLGTSAWDLVPKLGQLKTGFSGTNDNAPLLPFSTRQVDPVGQSSTNAFVLSLLLRPQNRQYTCLRHTHTDSRLTGPEFLQHLTSSHPEIRLLLDVGAQMLDMSNLKVAKEWLALSPVSVIGAVFFNDQDELQVIQRDGSEMPLLASTLKSRLADCVVYLDDSHTRGTDLRLPLTCRAAVTLGKKTTKDRLVQGCMRLRQLAQGQSLHFFAHPEVDADIRKLTHLADTSALDTKHIILWSMMITCADIAHHAPRWAVQGTDFKARSEALHPALEANPSDPQLRDIREAWVQPEARSLQEMYGVHPEKSSQLFTQLKHHDDIRARLEEIGCTHSECRGLDEEQEREVVFEVEQERQIERPPSARPLSHRLSDGLVTFARHGLITSGELCLPDHALLDLTTLTHHMGKGVFSKLWVTRDFMLTIDVGRPIQSHLKSVLWVLASDREAIVTSQFEANELMPILRTEQTAASLCLYSPRNSQQAPSMDRLDYFSIPSRLPRAGGLVQPGLSLFGGQLYPANGADFKALREFLGVVAPDSSEACHTDGFLQTPLSVCPFKTSSVAFVTQLLDVRRKGQDYTLAPLGRLLRGQQVEEKDLSHE